MRNLRQPAPNMKDAKQIAGVIICDSCATTIPHIQENDLHCNHCGKLVGLHKIVPDGFKFGIAVEGEIKIHGLDLKKAQELAALLNSIITGC